MKFLYQFILCIGVLSLSACKTLGPDFQEPVVDWVGKWVPSIYGELEKKDKKKESVSTKIKKTTDIEFWWELFQDPTLNQLIKDGRNNNLSLRIAGLKIFESRALLGIANSTLYPQVQQLGGSAAYVNNKSNGKSPTSQSFTSLSSALNVGWELDFWGRFQRGIESSDAAFFASINNQKDIQVLLTAQIANAYFTYRTTEARIDIAKQNAKIQKRSFEITTNIFESGEGSELDVQQAKTQYLATLSTIPELEIGLAKTLNALAVLLARKPGKIKELQSDDVEYKWPVISPKYFQFIPAKMLVRRADIRSAAWLVAAQSAQVGIAEAEYYPAISLFGTIGWSATSLSSGSNTGNFSVGPSFSWNILDYGRIGNNIRVQDSRLQQLIEQYKNTVILAAQEVDNASYSLVKTYEKKLLIEESLKASHRALALANIRYREGYSDFQRVLDAQLAMFTQSDRQLTTQGGYITTIIDLYKSMGGGWSEMSNEQLISREVKESMEKRTDWGELLSHPLPIDPIVTTPENSLYE